MNMQYEIRFYIKNLDSKTLSIFIDGKPVCKQTDKYIWSGNSGIHRIKINQVKMSKSKWYWVSSPLRFLVWVFINIFIFQGVGIDDIGTGIVLFNAVYEANIFVDKNMEIDVSLIDINRYKYEKHTIEYKIEVKYYPREVTIEGIRDEVTATKKERIIWFLLHAVLTSLFCELFMFTIIESPFEGISGVIFTWILSSLCMILWVYLIYQLYIYSYTEYNNRIIH